MAAPFLWGAATSAHQVEGNNVHSDWWAWEQRRPLRLRSGRAAEHYQRYVEDFALARRLGHNAHRLSLEWSRIQPARGVWNVAALAHYRAVLQELRKRGLTSFVTLHHFTNPLWLTQRGGWRSARTPVWYERYVARVVSHLGDLVDFWVTINEPMVYALESFWHKRWPPQRRSAREVWQVVYHLAQAHRRAYRVIHRAHPHASVGVAKHVIAYLTPRPVHNWWFNHAFFALTRGRHDFIGVNYYQAADRSDRRGPVSDIGWHIRPEGLTWALLEMRRYNVPLYVTENGLADAADAQRADFIRGHLRALEAAQAAGADVRGYFHWSLLDNFEWAKGFAPRFGLVAVDFRTMQRRVRPSALVYKAIIEQSQAV